MTKSMENISIYKDKIDNVDELFNENKKIIDLLIQESNDNLLINMTDDNNVQYTTLNSTNSSDNLSLNLIMNLEIDLPSNDPSQYLEECNIENGDLNIYHNSDMMDSIQDQYMILEECKIISKLFYKTIMIHNHRELFFSKINTKYDTITKEYNDLKLKFDKLKQLMIKSRKEEKLFREKTASEVETYEICIEKNNHQLMDYMNEIHCLKETNSKLVLSIQELKKQIEENNTYFNHEMHVLSKNLAIKIQELDMSRQANEFLNDENSKLKLNLKQTYEIDSDNIKNLRITIENEIKNQYISTIEHLQQQLYDMTNKLQNDHIELELSEKTLKQSVRHLRNEYEKLKIEFENISNENEQLKIKIATLSNDNSIENSSKLISNNYDSIITLSPLKKSTSTPTYPSISLDTFHSESENIDLCEQNHTNNAIDDEHTTSLLKKQIITLRDEIRKLERNQSRLDSIKSLEHFKDLFINFLRMNVNEKKNMVPFLFQTLQLNDNEYDIIKRFSEIHINMDNKNDKSTYSSWFKFLTPW